VGFCEAVHFLNADVLFVGASPNAVGDFGVMALSSSISLGGLPMKIAVVQQPPVYMDKEASIERAVALMTEAAVEGCGMIVFPETWLPGYPTFVWRLPPGAGMKKTDELFALSQANSIDLGANDLAPVQTAAREHAMVVVMGHQEIDSTISGSTLFNSVAIIDSVIGTMRFLENLADQADGVGMRPDRSGTGLIHRWFGHCARALQPDLPGLGVPMFIGAAGVQ
jgi:hypothetical protein